MRGWSRATLFAMACGQFAGHADAQQAAVAESAAATVAGLQAKDLEARRAAAVRLRDAAVDGRRRALPALIDLLMKEKDGQVRLAVLDAVTSLGPDAAPAVPALVHTLRTDYGGQRSEESHQDYRSAIALAAIGRPAVEGLRGLLKERKESVRAAVVMALGRIGPDAAQAIPDLVPLLAEGSERIGREATEALGRIGPPAIGALLAASAGKDGPGRVRAVEALGYLPAADDRASVALAGLAADGPPEVRAAALGAMARLKLPDEAVRPALVANLRHEDARVRLAAVDLLQGRKALLTGLTPELAGLLNGTDEGVCRHAAFLLSAAGPEAVPRLLDSLRRDGGRVGPIAEALARSGRAGVAPLSQALAAPQPAVRRGAALALGKIRPVDPATAGKLAAGLADADRDVRAACLTAIGELGPRGADAAPAVRGLLNDPSAEIRLLAVATLARCSPRDERLVASLAPLVDDPDPRVARRSIDVVRGLGPKGIRVLPWAVARLDDRDPDVRLAALEFVESHGSAGAAAIPRVTAMLDDAAPRVRMTAARTLGGLGKAAQPVFPRLTPLLDAPQPEVREAATSAMANLELEAEALRPHIGKVLRDDSPEVRRAASRAIQRLGPQGALFIPDIILMAEKKETAQAAERMLRRFERGRPDARSLPELVKQLDHKQEKVRLLAIKFLALAGRDAKDAIPALERMREDASDQVRKQAEAACKRIKETKPEPASKA
ncbi:putative lyase [Aquisphaera giovannonii]|uniref:Putative lyase n=1 Tax=Aquisphaera giovannonii TaxID=406548 RepID=A0A5B9W7T9_9BACT|nr:HEAT repeat domain-containing protein [Aquisphaera giovannonii]QEH36199.1 putative lyase [Aquisphaera giovannonii]